MFFCLYDFCLTFSRSAKHCCTRPVVLHAPSFFSLPSWRVEENTDRGVVGSGKMVGSYELRLYLAFLLGKNAYKRGRAFLLQTGEVVFRVRPQRSDYSLNDRFTAVPSAPRISSAGISSVNYPRPSRTLESTDFTF